MSDTYTCFGCEVEPKIAEIGMFAGLTRVIVESMVPAVIDSTIDVVIESDKVEANPAVDQKVSGVIDLTAKMSSVANSVDTEILDEIDTILCARTCTEETKAESLSGCPKLDLLMPKMLDLATKIQLP